MSSSGNKDVGEIITVECQDGPVLNRSCTDLLCCIIFTVTFVGLFGVAIYGFQYGQPKLLYTPMDPDGTFCGYSDNATDYPYIYFVAPLPGTLYRTTCVKTCPSATSTTIDCLTNSAVTNCSGILLSQITGTNSTTNSTNSTSNSSSTTNSSKSSSGNTSNTTVKSKALNLISKKKALKDIMLTYKGRSRPVTLRHLTTSYNYSEIVVIYPSVSFSTVCLPQLQSYLDAVLSSMNMSGLLEALEDLQATWTIALACCGISLVLGFIFMMLTRYCAKIIVWLFIFSFIVVLLVLGTVYVMKAENYTINLSGSWASVDSVISQVQSTTSSSTTSWIIGISCLLLGGFCLVLVCCFCSRIRLATAIIESAALFVAENPTSLLVPFFNFLTVIVWFSFAILGFLFIMSTGTITNTPKHFPFGNFSLTSSGEGMAIFFFCGAIWVFAFILHMAHFIFGLATSFWYFERMQKKTDHPMMQSTKWFFRYHVGSVALGSGIIAVIWGIKLVLSLIAKQQKQSQNKCGEFVAKCLLCCVSCFERFIAYLSKNAYTYIGMTSKNFCSSAWQVFQMILRNPLRFSVTGFLGDLFQLFGEGFICVLTAFCGYLIITKVERYADAINSPVYPTIVFAFVGFVVGSLFMTVYGAVADAILVVFVLDEEIHKNHKGKMAPEQIPAPLQEFVSKAEEHNSSFN